MIFGAIYTAMPISIVGNSFYDQYKQRHASHGYKVVPRVSLPARHCSIIAAYVLPRCGSGMLTRLAFPFHTHSVRCWL